MDISNILVWGLMGFFVIWIIWDLGQNSKNERKKREQLKEDIVSAAKHSQPTYEQLLDITDISGVDKKIAYDINREIMKEILTGKDEELQSHKNVIEGYILRHREVEPFEGIPSETRIHLERLSEALSDKDYSLEPLTIQIKELVSVYEKEKKTQKTYTTWSFFIGLAAILFAGYTYFIP